jgi:hypothetical protein
MPTRPDYYSGEIREADDESDDGMIVYVHVAERETDDDEDESESEVEGMDDEEEDYEEID